MFIKHNTLTVSYRVNTLRQCVLQRKQKIPRNDVNNNRSPITSITSVTSIF
jgi:hypothetical protein